MSGNVLGKPFSSYFYSIVTGLT